MKIVHVSIYVLDKTTSLMSSWNRSLCHHRLQMKSEPSNLMFFPSLLVFSCAEDQSEENYTWSTRR